MNSLNNSGMISAIQKPDGSPYDDSATPTPPQKRIVRSKSQTITPQQFPPNYIPSASLNQPQPSFSPYSQQSVMQAQPSAAFQNNPVEAKIQKLQEEWESDVQKAFRKQRLRFDNCALVEDFQGCLTYQCSNGENTIVKPFSPCRNLRAQKIIEHDTKKESIKYTFDTPTGEHKSVIVDATCSALHRYNLLRDNGFIVIAHLLPTVCGELIARYTAATRDSIPPQIKYSPGWYFSENHWGFQESEWVDLNTVLLSFTISPTPDVIMYQLVSLYAILQERLPSKMWIRRPLCILTHKYQCTDLSIDKTPLTFKKELENLRDRPIIWIRAEDTSFNESANAYSRDKNYQALLDSIQSSQKHPLYIVVSADLTPRQRTFCLPIQDFIEPCTGAGSINSVGCLIKSILNNADAFNSEVERCFIEASNKYGEDCSVQQEIATLSAIASIIRWHYSIQIPPQTFPICCDDSLKTYACYWDKLNDGNILAPFRNALYASRRSNMICFRSLEDVDISFDCQKEILYDDTYYYTSTALLKKIIKAHLSSYMPSDVLNRLKTTGVLSGSVPKTLTLAPNEPKDFRFRTLLRSSLHQPGSRDLVEI